MRELNEKEIEDVSGGIILMCLSAITIGTPVVTAVTEIAKDFISLFKR